MSTFHASEIFTDPTDLKQYVEIHNRINNKSIRICYAQHRDLLALCDGPDDQSRRSSRS